jgi:hypothetical protein
MCFGRYLPEVFFGWLGLLLGGLEPDWSHEKQPIGLDIVRVNGPAPAPDEERSRLGIHVAD